MVKVDEIIKVMEQTELVPYENEDTFSYYDRVTNEFLFFKTTNLHIAECKDINEESFENIYGEDEEIQKLCAILDDETDRYVYLKNPYTKSRLTANFIDSYKKDKNLYAQMNKAYGGKSRFAKLKAVLYENKILNVYNEYLRNALKNAAISWCCKNNIEYEK